MKNKVLPIILAVSLLSACSSIISKSEYSVSINSSPNGANFVVTNRAGQKVHRGITPASVTLKSSAGYFKGENYTIVLNKDGFSAKTFMLASSLDGWYWGNILLGGAIGMLIVDPATGAMYNLPGRVDISINQDVAATRASKDLTLATIDSLSDEQVTRLVEIRGVVPRMALATEGPKRAIVIGPQNYSIGKLARKASCVGVEGLDPPVSMIGKQGPFEVYEAYCYGAATIRYTCEWQDCKAMVVE